MKLPDEKNKPEEYLVVAMPVDLFQEVCEMLDELPRKRCNRLLNRLAKLGVQRAVVNPAAEVPENEETS
jgi:poly(A) polymerase Pap1